MKLRSDIISLREVGNRDLELLQKISRETFQESFSDQNTEENMRHYLENSLSLEKLTEEFNNPDSAFYIPYLNGEYVGYLKLNFENDNVEIERIYVYKPFHGKGIGQQLLDKALDIAREKNVSQIWLGVWEHNARAIAFYTKNGFEAFDHHIFLLGDDKQTDILMRRQLNY